MCRNYEKSHILTPFILFLHKAHSSTVLLNKVTVIKSNYLITAKPNFSIKLAINLYSCTQKKDQ